MRTQQGSPSPASDTTRYRCTQCSAFVADGAIRCTSCEIEFVGAFAYCIAADLGPAVSQACT